MKRLRLLFILGVLVLAGACRDSGYDRTPAAMPVTFQLRNDGISTVYLFESCQIDFTITSLADPVHQIALPGACACACGIACPVCGPCYEGPLDVATGTMRTAYWSTVKVTTEPTSTGGSCERQFPLGFGPYRIDVPVYPTLADATARMTGRTASQSFELPLTTDVIDIQLGLSP
jgi:hypothetical protein